MVWERGILRKQDSALQDLHCLGRWDRIPEFAVRDQPVVARVGKPHRI